MPNQTTQIPKDAADQPGSITKPVLPTTVYRYRSRMIFIFVTVTILAAVGITAGLYIRVSRNIRAATRQHMIEVVGVASLLIDADANAALTDPSQETSEEYLRIRRTLQRIRDTNPDIRYVYTMRYINNQQMFIVDAETDPVLVSHLGDIYEDVLPSALSMMAIANHPYVEPEFGTDQWGTWLTSCAPLFRANGTRGDFLCMDMAASSIAAQERQFLWIALAILAAMLPLAVGFGWWTGDRLAAPLASLIAGASQIAKGDTHHRVIVNTQDETLLVAQAFNNMASSLDEKYTVQVKKADELALELERRTALLTAAAELSRISSSNLDTDHLIQHSVDVIQEHYGFDYVGLFLLSDDGKWAVLRVGSGAVGEAMVKRHHRIALDEGMVGWCITNGQARAAQEATQDKIRLETPELPDTRSEAAIPLRTRGRIIGAISVQSTQNYRFDDITIESLQTMADELAVSLDNTRLLTENREAFSTVQNAPVEKSRIDWTKVFSNRPYIGYYANMESISPLDERSSGQDLSRLQAQSVLHLPIRVRGQALGTIHARKHTNDGAWNNEEIALIAALTDQLSLALDNARLYQDTQRSAEREHIVSDITAKVRASTNVNVILQTAIRELAEAFRVSKATIQISSDAETGGADHRSNGGDANG